MLYKLLSVIATCIVSFNIVKGSDTFSTCSYVSTMRFNYEKHGEQSLRILESNFDSLCTLPTDPEKRKEETDRLRIKVDAMLHNHTIVSSTKIVPNTLNRAILENETGVIGLVDFYQRAALETNYPLQWYIETLCIAEKYPSINLMALVQFALSKVKESGAKKLLAHTQFNDVRTQKIFELLYFKKLDPSEFEIKNRSVAFEYAFSHN